uniref:HMA domain-containing protein n=1 Tax=Oryza punctata TaxID=4537 RepID=A0A0E0LPM0_ORYPU
MASGEAEPLQYTTTVLRVSIHCEGCKKKVKKVLQNIEGVYKVTIDAAQHKVTVTSSVGDDALIRRLHKSGKHATPVMSYNVAHPSASVSSYYAPTPVMSMQPTPMPPPPPPPQMSYGYSPYPAMMMMPPPPPEYLYGPPGIRSSPPQESYSNMFNEENPSSCSVM